MFLCGIKLIQIFYDDPVVPVFCGRPVSVNLIHSLGSV